MNRVKKYLIEKKVKAGGGERRGVRVREVRRVGVKGGGDRLCGRNNLIYFKKICGEKKKKKRNEVQKKRKEKKKAFDRSSQCRRFSID
jgi:hypothetical protein